MSGKSINFEDEKISKNHKKFHLNTLLDIMKITISDNEPDNESNGSGNEKSNYVFVNDESES